MVNLPIKENYDKKATSDDLSVKRVVFTCVDELWQHKERFLYDHEFFFLTEGELFLRVGEEHYTLKKNDFIIFPPFSTFSGYLPSKKKCCFYRVCFKGNAKIAGERAGEVRHVSGKSVFLYEILKRLLSCYQYSRAESTQLDVLFLSLLYELKSTEVTATSDSEQLLQSVVETIYAEIGNRVLIEEIARKFHYSADHLSRLFRNAFGVSMKKYIDMVKIDTAKDLLSTSQLTVKQVGKSVGFDNDTLFNKFFKYHESLSPTEYRKQGK